MYAQLGAITFENLLAPTDSGRSSAAIYAEKPLIDGKARLQKTGDALKQINLAIRFHVNFCHPKEQLDALMQAMEAGDILPLVYGNGYVGGEYCIIQIDDFDEWTDPLGNRLSILVNVSLKESPTPDKLQQQQQDRINKADSVGDKKPVSKKKVNASQCSGVITGIISGIESHSGEINRIVTIGGGIWIPANRYTILQHLSEIKTAAQDLLTRCDDPTSCANGNADLKYRTQQVILAENSFRIVVTNNQIDQLEAQNQIMKACVRNLKAAAKTLINSSILRKNG